jgi:hypothetical protein
MLGLLCFQEDGNSYFRGMGLKAGRGKEIPPTVKGSRGLLSFVLVCISILFSKVLV